MCWYALLCLLICLFSCIIVTVNLCIRNVCICSYLKLVNVCVGSFVMSVSLCFCYYFSLRAWLGYVRFLVTRNSAKPLEDYSAQEIAGQLGMWLKKG